MKKISEKEFKKALELAQERINAANLLIQKKYYRQAISESYYVFFELASALVGLEGKIAKTHSGLITLFGKLYIKTGQINKKYADWFSEAFEKRQEADYERMTDFNKSEASNIFKKAKDFFNLVKEITKAF